MRARCASPAAAAALVLLLRAAAVRAQDRTTEAQEAAIEDPTAECAPYFNAAVSAAIPNFPTISKNVTALLPNDTAGKAKFASFSANIPNIAPRGTLGGDFTGVTYDQAADPDCWWTQTGCTTPKTAGVNADVKDVQPPRTLGYGFDDGPFCGHNRFYNFLESQNQKATLFYIGTNVFNFPLEAQRAVADGHEICVHTWSHPSMTAATNEGAFAELWYTQQAIKLVTGVTPTCWRTQGAHEGGADGGADLDARRRRRRRGFWPEGVPLRARRGHGSGRRRGRTKEARFLAQASARRRRGLWPEGVHVGARRGQTWRVQSSVGATTRPQASARRGCARGRRSPQDALRAFADSVARQGLLPSGVQRVDGRFTPHGGSCGGYMRSVPGVDAYARRTRVRGDFGLGVRGGDSSPYRSRGVLFEGVSGPDFISLHARGRACPGCRTRGLLVVFIPILPPKGDVDDRIRFIAQQLGLETIMWGFDSFDWEAGTNGITTDTVQSNYDTLISDATSGKFDTVGAIILTHELNNYTMQTAIDNYPKLAAAFDHLAPVGVTQNKTTPYVETNYTQPSFSDYIAARGSSTGSGSNSTTGSSGTSGASKSGSSGTGKSGPSGTGIGASQTTGTGAAAALRAPSMLALLGAVLGLAL
ncbi:hypothetical protein B0H17DRAFT_1186291 [Mycena rosella]|uniref:chitin deacetylase n=1 Tax=Mycena rosella TaxID=1033263 RepID=A0AAD7CMQ9_MYCRO|nr:hypothetical protein B0H17DRAFT_1186291 [Mycena rosella]